MMFIYLNSHGLAVNAYGLEVRAPTGHKSKIKDNKNFVMILKHLKITFHYYYYERKKDVSI